MDVKVVSMQSPNFQEELLESISNTGFVVLTDHGIEKEFIAQNQEAWKIFFESGLEIKKLFEGLHGNNLGYMGLKSEKAVGAKVADLKEFFHWKPGQTLPYHLISLTTKMYSKLSVIGSEILHAIDEDNNFETNYQGSCTFSNNTILRSLYYPALSKCDIEPGSVRAAAHEDINFITLLVAASSAGLQVKDKSGNWYDVPHHDNSLVMNIGDMLQLASKGKYKSTTHRVVNPNNSYESRISLPLFIHPHSDVELAPGFTAQEFLDQRIAEIYTKGK